MRKTLLLLVLAWQSVPAQTRYDLLLKGGHVLDPKNSVNRVMDVAVAGGKIARVALDIPASMAKTVVDASGLYITPGIIDIHAHVYTGTGERTIAGDKSVYPDGFSFRSGVTTMVDAGTSGWRNFADFKQRVIDRSKTRVLAWLNIGAAGMATGENDPAGLIAAEAAKVAKANAALIVGFKAAHYAQPDWKDIDQAVEAGRLADLPVMIDFGEMKGPRNLRTLLLEKLRPGDIYTHCYSGRRGEVIDGVVNPAVFEARKKGVIFDIGHGNGSFYWSIAAPAVEQHFVADSISTDLHTGSMNEGMKDIVNLMSKMLSLGVPMEDVIRMTTWNPAREIKRPALGNLDVGSDADITVLSLQQGQFGFLDSFLVRHSGDRKLAAEMTILRGAVVWDLNGRAGVDWKSYAYPKLFPPR